MIVLKIVKSIITMRDFSEKECWDKKDDQEGRNAGCPFYL